MKIEKITTKICVKLRNEINEALSDIAEAYGLDIAAKNARFTDDNVTFKLEVSLLNEHGEPQTKEEVFLRENHDSLGVPKEWLGQLLVDPKNNKLYKLTGYKTRSPKRPFLVKDASSGVEYKVTRELLKRMELATKIQN